MGSASVCLKTKGCNQDGNPIAQPKFNEKLISFRFWTKSTGLIANLEILELSSLALSINVKCNKTDQINWKDIWQKICQDKRDWIFDEHGSWFGRADLFWQRRKRLPGVSQRCGRTERRLSDSWCKHATPENDQDAQENLAKRWLLSPIR